MKPRYIAHTGGKMPVAASTRVEIVTRNGVIHERHDARYWNADSSWWEHQSSISWDIIAYRVINQE